LKQYEKKVRENRRLRCYLLSQKSNSK
jgi:hypothetical protein